DMKAGGGMEYPTITLIDRVASAKLETVVVHEAGHNWFYGMLGTNERDHAWMDEGINTFYEEKTSREVSTKKKRKQKMDADLNNMLYYEATATHTDQAIDQTSANFTKLNYGGDVYFKTALMMRWLEAYMGEESFEQGMQDYYNTWRFKHPYPEDLKAVLQKHTDKSLDWFFDGMLHTDRRIDFKVKHAGSKGFTVKSKSSVTAPVGVDIYERDSLVGKVWSAPFEGKIKLQIPEADAGWTKLKIDDNVVDSKPENDLYRRYGLFKKFGVKVKPFAGLNMSDKEKLFVSPAIGYNNYDGFMLGLVLHDLTIPENRFRFALAPMIGFNSGDFVGAGSVGYVWYPDNIFKELLLQADGKSFHYNEIKQPNDKWVYAGYTKIAPSLNITFNEHNLLTPVTRTLTLKAYNITEDQFNTADSNHISLKQQQKTYGLLRYSHVNDRAYNPFNYKIEGQLGADFAKVSVEGNLRIDYFKKNKALYVRAYAGKFFGISSDPAVLRRYYLTTSYTGMNDYLYDGTYFDRSNVNSALAQQMSMQEGGFKVPTFNGVGMSDNYMVALNLKSDLPIKLPIRLFLDVVDYSEAEANTTKGKILYDGGVEIHILKDVFTFNIPLVMSSELHDNLKSMYGSSQIFPHSLSFSIKLNNMNWLKSPSLFMKMISG
ncbi:MAG: M1 family aminopeptidase, partial [Flavipsychrobacter sp.]